ncbi:hypothetical protein Cgig2_032775 [Carnegiea gigantea]|uniref:DUF3598 domain-containing protein n=1 Tax=Carnegiea gigantea TaxID=171969 RepID=A0A9Q1GKN7_9CARY|nr:hypothetical protein Cgig2_032775 [Carnegiea gigantea]
MAALSCSLYSLFPPKLLFPIKIQPTPLQFPNFRTSPTFQNFKIQDKNSTASAKEQQKEDEDSMSIDNLHRFVQLNLGSWTGSFYQFDANGKVMHKIDTKLSASSYGEDELISLIQTCQMPLDAYFGLWTVRHGHVRRLYIKQPPLYGEEPEWAEYKIKESNMFTVDKYQQIGFFPNERAFALRYQTAGMLETVLRQGVLGENDTGEVSPRNLKVPSSWPSIVCENCLYSMKKDMRARAFHIMDPKGVLEMLILFLEERGSSVDIHPSLEDSEHESNRLVPFLGRWKGQSITKRSGVYGATLAEHDTMASLEIDENGQLIQEEGKGKPEWESGLSCCSCQELCMMSVFWHRGSSICDRLSFVVTVCIATVLDITTRSKGGDITTNVQWTGTMHDNLISFDRGFQLTLLPGGMYMGYPSDIAKSVAESKSFHLEFCWLESPDKRQRLVRTYDVEGLAVSSTYFLETKV